MRNIDVSLVIPVYNEQENLAELFRRCTATCDEVACNYEIIAVDDGSTDGSRNLIRQAAIDYKGKVSGIFLNRNYGQHPAVMAGLAHSRGRVVVTLDADLQNPPEEIPKLLVKVEEGCDVVGSYRLPRNDSIFRRIPSWLVNALVRKTTGIAMQDYGCMLRAYKRNVVNAMLSCDEHDSYIPVLANCFASKTADVAVNHAGRGAGQSKYGFWKLINLQFDLLTTMTTFPLRVMSVIGVLLAALGTFGGVLIGVLRLVYGSVWAADGVLTVIAALLIFAGLQFVGLGLLGEYISRIHSTVRARPRYYVQERVGSSSQTKPNALVIPLDQNQEISL